MSARLEQLLAALDRVERERDEARRGVDVTWEQLRLAQRGFRERNEARAEADRLREALRTIDAVVEAWANDEIPEVDHPFDADMDFLNYVGHVARAALAGSPREEQPVSEHASPGDPHGVFGAPGMMGG